MQLRGQFSFEARHLFPSTPRGEGRSFVVLFNCSLWSEDSLIGLQEQEHSESQKNLVNSRITLVHPLPHPHPVYSGFSDSATMIRFPKVVNRLCRGRPESREINVNPFEMQNATIEKKLRSFVVFHCPMVINQLIHCLRTVARLLSIESNRDSLRFVISSSDRFE